MSQPFLKFNSVKTIKLSGDINSCNFNIFNTIAMGTSDKCVSVWEWTDEGYIETNYSPLLYHDYAVTSVVFSPDGLTLATSSADGMTYIISSKKGAVLGSIVQSIGGGVRESAIYGNLLATVTDDGYVFLWNLVSYQIHRYWVGHEACVSCVSFSTDGILLATGDSDGTFKLWLVNRAISNLFTIDTLRGHVQKDAHDGGVLSITFFPDRFTETELAYKEYRLCSAGDDNVVRMWHVSVEALPVKEHKMPDVSVQLLMVFEGHLSSVTAVRFSPDGLYLGSSSLDSSARIWEVSTGICIRVLSGHRHSVFCCAFTPELAFFASGSNDKTVSLWHLTNEPVPVHNLAIDLSDTEGDDLSTKQRYFDIKEVLPLDAHVNSLDFNNNNDLVVGTSDKIFRTFTRKGGKFIEKGEPSKVHNYSVVNVEFSRCGRLLLTNSIDGSVIVWNYAREEMMTKTFLLSKLGGRAARFIPMSDCLGLGDNDGKAYLWCISSQTIICSYPGHLGSVNCLSFTPDGEFLATGCSDGYVKVWRSYPACSINMAVLDNIHDLGVMSLDFSHATSHKKGMYPKVYRMATGGNDSLVKVFKMWPVTETLIQAEEIFCMRGHGGSITEVRFSNKSSDVLASTAIDRTTRIWNMQNGQCLNVLSHHKGQVTCCAFSADSTLFATGSLDSTVIIWKVPTVISLHNRTEKDLPPRSANPEESLDRHALSVDDVNLSMDDLLTVFRRQSAEIPDHMLCPITQQIMVNPVICEDGFTYEHDAIQAWMVNGRNTSPMTNVSLTSTVLVPNTALLTEIRNFLVVYINADYPGN